MNPKVSVIMAVYNAGSYLRPAVTSVLKQSYRDFELILVDDGATDGSGELCDIMATEDNRIRVIHQKNMGICVARNTGLYHAKGELIAFCDHDDLYLENYLKVAVEVMNVNYDIDLVKFGYVTEYITENLKYKIHSYSVNRRCVFQDVINDYAILNQCVKALWNGIYKMSIIKKEKIIFDTFYRSGVEDYDFNLKYLQYCKKIMTISDELFIHYMRNGQSADTKFSVNKLESWEKVFNIEYNFIREYCNNREIREKQFVRCQGKYITSLMSCLLGCNCSWSIKEKISYLKKLRNNSNFLYLDKQICRNEDSINLAQRVLLILFAHRYFLGMIIYMTFKIELGNWSRYFKGRLRI